MIIRPRLQGSCVAPDAGRKGTSRISRRSRMLNCAGKILRFMNSYVLGTFIENLKVKEIRNLKICRT